MITSGYYQGLGLLSGVLATSGTRTAAVEDPGHNAFREVVQRAGLITRALPVDAHGARVEALTLCAWARSTGGPIIKDDYDGEYRYDRQPVGALQGIAPDHVVYCGTASKTLGPALRLAWLVLHIRAARLRYRRRRELLLGRVATIPGLTVHGVPAGLHTLITLSSDGPTEDQRLSRCARHGIALRGLTELHHDPANRPQGLLIGFAAPSERAYPAALDALSTALASSDGRRLVGSEYGS